MAHVLFSKKLDEQGMRLIDKALKLAIDHDRFESTILLMQNQKNSRLNTDTISVDELGKYYVDMFSTINKLNTKLEFNKMHDELLLQRRTKGSVKNKEEHNNINPYYNNPLFRDFSKINSMNANMHYLLAKVEYAIIIRNRKMGRLYAKKLISLFERDVSLVINNTSLYISILSNFVGGRLYLNNREEANNVLEKMIKVPKLIGKNAMTNTLRVKIFERYYGCLTDVALTFKDYESAIPVIQKVEVGFKEFEKWMTPTISIVLKLNIACVYFGAGNFRQALKWCNENLNDPSKLREDVFYKLRILNILIHYELGNGVILPHLIKSTYRYLYKRKMVYKFENLFLEYFRLLIRSETKQEQTILFIQFRMRLIPLLSNNIDNYIFDDINIIGWMDGKIK